MNGLTLLATKIKNKVELILLGLVVLAFAISVISLQTLKAPWVDECYSYYGIWHDNFSEFYDSMLTGINFSPPLYFFLNFLIQCIQPTSIELLRLQSLAWIIIGIILTYFCSRKVFDSTSSILATMLVLAQSNILLAQAQEARHYAMFFACGAWVLYMQTFHNSETKMIKFFTFLAHFCLCQVHYLGIVFSLLSGTAYFINSKKKSVWKRIPRLMTLSWFLTILSYLFYLSNQKSILNTWPKPNGLSHLLSSYNGSILFLTILIPVSVMIFLNTSNRDNKNHSIEETYNSRPIIVTSVLWFSVALVAWVLSHLSPLNLFVDRYFIPKESGLIVIVAFIIKKFQTKFYIPKKSTLPAGAIMLFSAVIITIEFKRSFFSMNPDRNFHHWMIVKDKFLNIDIPVVFTKDPFFFPNDYRLHKNCFFLINNTELAILYEKFSNKVNIINNKNLINFKSFFLVSDSDLNISEIDSNFIQQDSVVLQNGLKTYIKCFKSVMSSNDKKFN